MSSSKVKASIGAVKSQFPENKLVAILELHTYSSLNENFLTEYSGAMNSADVAVVFYSRHALEIKRMKDLDPAKIREGFQRPDLIIFRNKEEIANWLHEQTTKGTHFLFMSSGNYEGLDILKNLRLF